MSLADELLPILLAAVCRVRCFFSQTIREGNMAEVEGASEVTAMVATESARDVQDMMVLYHGVGEHK